MKKIFPIRAIILAGSLLLQLSTFCFQSCGAAGDVDLSFDPGSGVNGPVNAVAVQPDGKVITGGEFTMVKGLARSKIARLNADGSGDSSFNPSAGGLGSVSSVALQADGKVLVGHDYGIIRLNSNGGLDTNFTVDLVDFFEYGITPVKTIAVQPDGKVLIGGEFATTNGANWNFGLARLHSDGNLDSSFNPGTVWGYSPLSIALQPDGKVLFGGWVGINRLNTNGSTDNGFNSGSGVSGLVYSVVVQVDDKVLIGGDFTAVNGTNRNRIARLNSNGSLDDSFNPGAGVGGSWVSSVVLQSDGKVFIGGLFNAVNGTNLNGIARLNANGGLDTNFNPGTGASSVRAVALQSNGQVLVGGAFTTVNGTNRNRIARLNADGSLDGSFHPGTGVDNSVPSLVLQPDGKVLIGSVFTFINGTNRYGNARLNADGIVDNTFISASFNPDLAAVFIVACPPDRICENTTIVTSLAVQTDGKVLIGGSCFHQEVDGEGFLYDRYVINRVGRFNANGSLDGSFNFTNTESLGRVSAIALQSDGKAIVVNEFYPSKIARLNANGSPDGSFNPGTGLITDITSVALQPDGKVLVGGTFTNINGTYRFGIVRLNANGSLDGSFNPATEVSGGSIFSIVLQPDGKVLIGGSFTTISGTNRNHVARLNAIGSLDASFNPGTGPDGIVRSIALQPDGNMLIAGDFLTVNGVLRPHVARLYGDSGFVVPSLDIERSNAFVIVSWPVTGLNFQLQENTNLSLLNSWSPVAQPAVTNAGQISVTVHSTVGRKFFRLKMQ